MRKRIALTVAIAALLAGGAAVALAGTGGHTRRQHSGGHGLMASAVGYLGLSPQQLRSERHGGRTLGEIADTVPGKSSAGLLQAIVGARTAQLSGASTKGKPAASGESARLAHITARAKALIARLPGAKRSPR